MKEKFPYGKTLIVGFGFLGISIIWPIFNQFIPLFLQAGNPEFERQLLEAGRAIPDITGFAIAPFWALLIMTMDNIINVFVQPWVGERSDRTWNRFGRRKGWILLGLPIAVVGFVFIPLAQTIFTIAAFIFITNFGMALFRSPTVAWLGDLYAPEQRSKANGVINLMGGVGALFAFFVGGWLFDNVGRAAPFYGGAVMLAISALTAVFFVREPEKIEVEQNDDVQGVIANLKVVFQNTDRSGVFVLVGILFWFMAFNALETALSSFAVFTLGIEPGTASFAAGSVSISFIIFAVPAGLLGSRFGRRRTIQGGLIGLTVVLLLGFIIIQNLVSFVVVLVLAGAFWATVNVNSLPLVYDYGDERKIGAYTGLYYFASQSAAILGPSLGGALVDLLNDQYRWIWLFSMVFMALAWLVMNGVRDRKSVPAGL